MDPQQQQALNQMAGMGVGIMAFAVIFSLVITIFFIWLFWRIFTKAGMSGALALLNLIPVIGPLVVLFLLAFGKWNVVPVTPGYAQGATPAYPPAYPQQAYTPPAYPPQNYPPANPPTQL